MSQQELNTISPSTPVFFLRSGLGFWIERRGAQA